MTLNFLAPVLLCFQEFYYAKYLLSGQNAAIHKLKLKYYITLCLSQTDILQVSPICQIKFSYIYDTFDAFINNLIYYHWNFGRYFVHVVGDFCQRYTRIISRCHQGKYLAKRASFFVSPL